MSRRGRARGSGRASRASRGGTARGTRSSAAPHVRVNPDQEFLIEWASGHPGSYHYLVVLKATDEAQMATHSEAMLNDYLDTAPAALFVSTAAAGGEATAAAGAGQSEFTASRAALAL